MHCHNDFGLSVANSISAIQAGAGQVECTINGIGERAGNCSMEEFVMALKTRGDILPFKTNVVTDQLTPASRLLTAVTGIVVQPNKASWEPMHSLMRRESISTGSDGKDHLRDNDPGIGRS